jgi:hypothetical protein
MIPVREDGVADLAALRMTPERKAARRKTLNCSELPILWRGDPGELNHLARVKWGEADEAELDRRNVEAGQFIEPLILAWVEEETGLRISRTREVVRARRRPWLSCTFDGYLKGYRGGRWVVQTKFYHPRYPVQGVIDERAAQCLGEAYCDGADGTLLAVYNQGEKLEMIEIPADPVATAELLRLGDEFWAAVREQRLPFPQPAQCAPPLTRPALRLGEIEMEGEAWDNLAARWLDARGEAKKNEAAEDALKKLAKELAPQGEASRLVGGGVEAEVDARGAVKLRVLTPPFDASTHNAWVSNAQGWLGTRAAVEEADAVADALKKLLPADRTRAFGAGVDVKANARGAISIGELADPAAAKPKKGKNAPAPVTAPEAPAEPAAAAQAA